MTKKPTLPTATTSQRPRKVTTHSGTNSFRSGARRSKDNSDVLVSAVLSTYLLTYLHHVLQQAECLAVQQGRKAQATNFAQLRKVLCMDARSMKDASASGLREADMEKFHDSSIRSKVA